MTFLCDEVLYARTFVEAMTGYYPFNCDTVREFINHLASNRVFIGNSMWKLTDSHKIPEKADCVIVQFSKEDCYTESCFYIVRILKSKQKEFLRNLKAIMNMED